MWRGALGAVVGSSLKAVAAWIYYSFVHPQPTWGYIGRNPVVFFAVIGIPLAAIIGAMVGAILGLVGKSTGRSFGFVARIVFGGGIVGLLGAIFMHPRAGLPIDNLISWLIVSIFYWDFGVGNGVMAGMFVRSGNGRATKRMTTDVKGSMMRGALGGLLGGLIGAVILLPRDTSNYAALLLLFLIWHLPVAAIVGALLGLAVSWIQANASSNIGVVAKTIIAAILGGLTGAIVDSLVLTDATLAILGRYYTKYGVIVGAVSGVVLVIQRSSKPSSSAPE